MNKSKFVDVVKAKKGCKKAFKAFEESQADYEAAEILRDNEVAYNDIHYQC